MDKCVEMYNEFVQGFGDTCGLVFVGTIVITVLIAFVGDLIIKHFED